MTVPLDLDKGTLLLRNVLNNTGRVHLHHVRQKDGRRGASDDGSGLHVLRFQEFQVLWKRPGIGREVLVWRELCRVHEDGDDGKLVIS